MEGYLKNAAATDEAFRGGWFHTGDLAVWHPDGYVEIKDRSKDIIISGGENISSLEVEEVLYRHPAVMEAAVVARPDANWDAPPTGFVARVFGLRERATSVATELRAGVTTFMVMAYIIFVNPIILGFVGVPGLEGKGLPFAATLTVTCLTAGVLTIAMGLTS